MSDSLPVLPGIAPLPEAEAGFGALETSRGPLPLKALDVRARILGLVTRVTVVQSFVNTHQEPLEAVYVFPLPPRAAVTGFCMRVGDRLVQGNLFERQQARERYAQALREGKRAALAEEDRPNLFTLSVGNLMPGDEAEITFELAGLLTLEGDEAEWRFPLVVAPRYIPGSPLEVPQAGLGTTPDSDRVPDASRLNPPLLLPGYPNPVRLGIEVEWDAAGLAMTGLRSSLHAVTGTPEAGRTVIRLAQRERLDRDFILRCDLRAEAIQASAVLVPDDGVSGDGGTGTLMVTLLPPAATLAERPGREVVFLVDRSGSMGGWKILAARRAVARMVDTLGPRDRFEVLTFDDQLESAGGRRPALVPASDRNRFRALEFLARTEARGGTRTELAIQQALILLKPSGTGAEPVIFLVTDGQVGDEDGLLRLIGRSNCRFQILGIDRALNDGLLQRLANATQGWFLAAESEDRLDAVLELASRKFGAPLVTGLRLTGPGLEWLEGSPVSSGSLDLYPGAPLVLLGRCKGVAGSVTAEGAGEEGRFFRTLAVETRQQSALRHTWARWRVRDLEDELVRAGDPGSARKRLIEISLAHGVLCRFTAFLAVDDGALVNPQGRMETILQPVESPSGWAAPAMMASVSCVSYPTSAAPDPDGDFPFIMEDNSCAFPMPRPAGAPSRRMPPSSIQDRQQEAEAAARELNEFLLALGPLDALTQDSIEFPEAFFTLLRLLKGRGMHAKPAARDLFTMLKAAELRHRFRFHECRLLQALVGHVLDALGRFLLECAGGESTATVAGGRAFWEP